MKLLERTEAPKHGTALLWTSRTISLYFAWAVIAQVTYFCTDYLGLNAAIVGSLMLFSKVADCISNFLIANYVDNGSSKWGKVRQYEIHIVLLWVDVVLMFMIPSGWGATAIYFCVQLQSNMQSTPSTYYFTYIVGNLSLMSLVTLVGYIAALPCSSSLKVRVCPRADQKKPGSRCCPDPSCSAMKKADPGSPPPARLDNGSVYPCPGRLPLFPCPPR